MTVQIHVIRADWNDHRETLRRIREAVFIDEQEVPRELEWDGEDESSHHYLAVNELGDYIGCARLMSTGQIGRMAVSMRHAEVIGHHPAHRGRIELVEPGEQTFSLAGDGQG